MAACGQREATQIRVENGWIAEIPPVIKVTAALMTLHNYGDRPRYLVGASSPYADSIEMHKSTVVNDLARMEQQHEIEIPPKGSVEFSYKTGYHLMFYGAEKITEGQKIPITLQFKDGASLTWTFDVVNRRKMM